MAQFDQLSFLNQVSWFLFFFFAFYFFINFFFIPKISFIIKFRKKKIINNNYKKIYLNLEKEKKKTYFNKLYFDIYKKLIKLLQKKYKLQFNIKFSYLSKSLLIKNNALILINLFLNKNFITIKKF